MSDPTDVAAKTYPLVINCDGSYTPSGYVTLNHGDLLKIDVDPNCSGVTWTIQLYPAVPSAAPAAGQEVIAGGGTIKVGS